MSEKPMTPTDAFGYFGVEVSAIAGYLSSVKCAAKGGLAGAEAVGLGMQGMGKAHHGATSADTQVGHTPSRSVES